MMVGNKMAFPLLTGTYLSRGVYAPQLARWDAVYGREKLLVVSQDDLQEGTQATMDTVFEFLSREEVVRYVVRYVVREVDEDEVE